jgi:hypothetical protein
VSPYLPRPPEFVLDTDIVVAGAVGFSRQPLLVVAPETRIIKHWLGGEWKWATSEELLAEHEDVLIRRGASDEKAHRIVEMIREGARMVVPKPYEAPLPDPGDRHVVATVRTAGVPLCSRNVQHYPESVIRVYTPEEMLVEIDRYLQHPMVRR